MKKPKTTVYGIKCTDAGGTSGWIVDNKLNVEVYATKAEAEKEIKKKKRDQRYTWNCIVEAAEYKGEENDELPND